MIDWPGNQPKSLTALRLATVLLLAALTSCSSNPILQTCGVAGRQRSCTCAFGGMGIQTCGFDGSWTACLSCDPIAGPATGGGGAPAPKPAGHGGGSGTQAAGSMAGRGH